MNFSQRRPEKRAEGEAAINISLFTASILSFIHRTPNDLRGMYRVSMMRTECLPIDSIPQITPLFRDYLTNFPLVASFYPSPPLNPDYEKMRASLDYPTERRLKVAEILREQNRGWGASSKTLDNIERLRNGASAIVTGQQVSLFGGPLFSFLKALTALMHADAATKAGAETVPIFWLATEDHDLAEVSFARLYGNDSSLKKLSLHPAGTEGSAVGSVSFGDDLKILTKEAAELLGDSEVTNILTESYVVGANFGDAFAKMFAKIFADFGLIVLDASDPALHKISMPIYRAAAAKAEELNGALMERSQALVSAGYHAQVKVTSSSTLLFASEDGIRTAVHRSNGHFSIGKRKLSQAELTEQITQYPGLFSANALMRPAVQDYLLPTLAYVGGPAEVAYFAQSSVVYQHLLNRVTPILPRISATIVEQDIQKRLQQYGLKVSDAFIPSEHLQQRIAKQSLPESLMDEFAETKAETQSLLDRLSKALGQVDKTLIDAAKKSTSKMLFQLNRLESRAARAQTRKSEVIARHAQQISTALFPDKELQEREIAGVVFLARHGLSFLEEIRGSARTDCPGHQVFYL